MEDIRLAAKAYYNNCSEEVRKLARTSFQAIDTNGDGRVSPVKFVHFLEENGNRDGSQDADFYKWVKDSEFFTQLDADGDGSLDFSEFITFFYLLTTRQVWCGSCRSNLFGLYFTCVDCYNGGGETTFDVCVHCYSEHRFCHHHSRFLDSFVLLRTMVSNSERADANQAPSRHMNGQNGQTRQKANGQNNIKYSTPAPGAPGQDWTSYMAQLGQAVHMMNEIANHQRDTSNAAVGSGSGFADPTGASDPVALVVDSTSCSADPTGVSDTVETVAETMESVADAVDFVSLMVDVASSATMCHIM